MQPYRILIVEDDGVIASSVARYLSKWGFETQVVTDFHDVMATFGAFDPHLVVLDIYLPFYNGYHWCTEIRKQSSAPILYLSSAADKMNIVMAMNMGGDDFVTKPFEPEILTAKIQALLRRSYDYAPRLDGPTCRGAVLNTADASLSYDGTRLELTRNELRILGTLMQEPGRIVSRDGLMQALWETDCYVDENTLTVNVARLRKKLAEVGLSDFIVTKKGLGYLVE